MVFTSCVTTVKLNRQFYNTQKVGVILEVDDIGMAKTGSQGLLEMALTPGNRFKEALEKVGAQLNPKETLKQEIIRTLTAKNKAFVFLTEEAVAYQDLPDFKKPKSKKKFPRKDFRTFKERNDIDQLLYVKARYGLLVSYYGVIETGKQGYINIATQIIDLADNSLLQAETMQSVANIRGKWKSGSDYEYMRNAIQEAINKSLPILNTKLQ